MVQVLPHKLDGVFYFEKEFVCTRFRHCPVPAGGDKEDHWTRIVAPTMAKKYSDMRCNVNNNVHKALSSE